MPKNCGMADAELAARGRMRRGTRESRFKPPKKQSNRRFSARALQMNCRLFACSASQKMHSYIP
jgi:hypothetical protein